jgi:hypothetical protein
VDFFKLWEMTQHVHLDIDTLVSIIWKFGKDGSYSAISAYKMQFLGHTTSPILSMVWRPWASPKCKTFAWLVIRNLVWTADNYINGDAQIAVFANFATKFKNRPCTSFFIVGSLEEFGYT